MNKKTRTILIAIIAILLILIGLFFFKSKEKFIVEFEGVEMANIEVEKDGKIKRPEDPKKEGYTFVGWYLDGQPFDFNTPITKNMKLEARFEVALSNEEYEITFNTDGGSKIESIKLKGNSLITKPVDPTKDGYDFVEWQYNGQAFDFNNQRVTSQMELKAIWKEKGKLTITFSTDGGSTMSSQVIKPGEKIKQPANPAKKGYKFISWQKDGKDFDFNTPVTESITLTAKWEKLDMVTVTFNSDGGSSVAKQEVEKNKVCTKPANPTKKGYKFISWQLDGKDYDFGTKVTKDITLKAKWEKVQTYTVTFMNGDNEYKKVTVEKDKTVAKPTAPTKSGYKFVSWQLDGKDYNFGTKVTKDITLKAKWVKTYTVTFETNGGTSVASQTIEEGGKATKPANPTKAGYTFDGWDWDFNKVVTSNITIPAMWKANPVVRNISCSVSKVDAYSPSRILTFTEGGKAVSITSIMDASGNNIPGKIDGNKKYIQNTKVCSVKKVKLSDETTANVSCSCSDCTPTC